MDALVSLHNLSDETIDEVLVKNIENKYCFSYLDNNGVQCEICVYDDGLCLFRQTNDYLMELHLKSSNYAKITSSEGIIKIDVIVLDFSIKGDILKMHYLVNDEERIIKIKYC